MTDSRCSTGSAVALTRESILDAVLRSGNCGIGDIGPDGKWRPIACNDESLKGDRHHYFEECDCSKITDGIVALLGAAQTSVTPYDNAAFKDTDDAEIVTILAAVRHCANSWDGSARLVGNVRAWDISRACTAAINVLAQPVPGGDKGEAVAWTKDELVEIIMRETTGKIVADGWDHLGSPNVLIQGCKFIRRNMRTDPTEGYAEPETAAKKFAGFIADAVLAATPQPASNAGGEAWKTADFWEFVSKLTGGHEADQMRDMLAQRDLKIVGITDPAYAAQQTSVLVEELDLSDMLVSWEDAANYKGDFLRKKHGDTEEIARYRAKYLSLPSTEGNSHG